MTLNEEDAETDYFESTLGPVELYSKSIVIFGYHNQERSFLMISIEYNSVKNKENNPGLKAKLGEGEKVFATSYMLLLLVMMKELIMLPK